MINVIAIILIAKVANGLPTELVHGRNTSQPKLQLIQVKPWCTCKDNWKRGSVDEEGCPQVGWCYLNEGDDTGCKRERGAEENDIWSYCGNGVAVKSAGGAACDGAIAKMSEAGQLSGTQVGAGDSVCCPALQLWDNDAKCCPDGGCTAVPQAPPPPPPPQLIEVEANRMELIQVKPWCTCKDNWNRGSVEEEGCPQVGWCYLNEGADTGCKRERGAEEKARVWVWPCFMWLTGPYSFTTLGLMDTDCPS